MLRLAASVHVNLTSIVKNAASSGFKCTSIWVGITKMTVSPQYDRFSFFLNAASMECSKKTPLFNQNLSPPYYQKKKKKLLLPLNLKVNLSTKQV